MHNSYQYKFTVQLYIFTRFCTRVTSTNSLYSCTFLLGCARGLSVQMQTVRLRGLQLQTPLEPQEWGTQGVYICTWRAQYTRAVAVVAEAIALQYRSIYLYIYISKSIFTSMYLSYFSISFSLSVYLSIFLSIYLLADQSSNNFMRKIFCNDWNIYLSIYL